VSPSVPPIVRARVIESVAYLLGWERLPVTEGRGWGARIAWVEQTADGAWQVRGGVVPANAVRPVNGEDYAQVPRDPRPSDPSDPRDPKSGKHERDREFLAELRRAADPWGLHERRMRKADGPF